MMTTSNGTWDFLGCPLSPASEDGNGNPDSSAVPESPNTSSIDEISGLTNVFDFLDLFDLMMCRQVSKIWNEAVTHSESFLTSAAFYVSLEPCNSEVISGTQVPWRYIRIKLFDILEYFQGQDTDFPPISFFSEIKTIEFHQCIVSWNTIKKLVLNAPNVNHLILTRCLFQEGGPIDIDNELSLAVLAQMTQFTITDVADVRGIMTTLQKLVIYNASSIEALTINFHLYYNRVSREIAMEFCTVLAQLLERNARSLRTLILNIRSTEILNFFCPIVLSRLEMFYCLMKLEVFQLAPAILGGPNEAITFEAPRAMLILCEFIGTQTKLKSVAFPHLQNLGSYEGRRWQLAEYVNREIKRIRVPGTLYLRRNFLKTFNNMAEFFIGEKTCPGPTGLVNPVKYIYDYRTGIVKANCRKVREMGIYARVNYESGMMYHILEKFPSLTKFELDVFRALIDDKDLQSIIKYLPQIKYLSITHCDLITDVGITGIPAEVCKNLHNLSTIYTHYSELKPKKLRSKDGRPLSDLKGLTTFELFGKAKLTDVGIKLGLEFLSLQNLHLPMCDRITEWGMVHLGKQNPSLRFLALTGATPSTVVGCTQLLNEHPRLMKQNCRIMSITEQVDDEFAQPSLLTAILWDN